MPVLSTVADGLELGGEYVEYHERTRVGAVAAVLAALGLVAAAGLRGIAAAAVLGIAWLLLSSTDAFALGQVAIVAFAWEAGAFGTAASGGLLGGASGLTVVGIAVAEVGLFGLLLAPAMHLPNSRETVALALGWASAGGVLAWASAASWLAPWLAGFALLGVGGLAAYGLHRYQIVALGLVEGVEREVGESEQATQQVGERDRTDGQGGDASER